MISISGKDTFRQTKDEQRHLTLQCLTVKPKTLKTWHHKGAKMGFAMLVLQNHAKRCLLCACQRGNRLREWRLTLKKQNKQKWVCHYKRQTSLTSPVSQPRGHFSPVFFTIQETANNYYKLWLRNWVILSIESAVKVIWNWFGVGCEPVCCVKHWRLFCFLVTGADDGRLMNNGDYVEVTE